MKQQKPMPSRPDPNAKNEPAKRIQPAGKDAGKDDVRQANEEGRGRDVRRARDANVRQEEADDVGNANEEA